MKALCVEVCESPVAEHTTVPLSRMPGLFLIRCREESFFKVSFLRYQGSWGESVVDRQIWLPSVSIPGPRGVLWVRAACVRAEPCGRTDWVRGAGRVWPGVTERRAGQMQAGTDSTSSSSQSIPLLSLSHPTNEARGPGVKAAASNRGTSAAPFQNKSPVPWLTEKWSFGLKYF